MGIEPNTTDDHFLLLVCEMTAIAGCDGFVVLQLVQRPINQTELELDCFPADKMENGYDLPLYIVGRKLFGSAPLSQI